TRIDELRHDVHTVLQLKRHEIGLPVLDFIERRLFPSGTADVGERLVVVDRGNEEWFTCGLCVERVIKAKFRRVGGTEVVDLFRGPCLRGANLLCGLVVSSFEFLLVSLGVGRLYIAAKRIVRGRTLFRLDK